MRIDRIAAQVNMEAVDLVQLALAEVFNDPALSLDASADLIRRVAGRM